MRPPDSSEPFLVGGTFYRLSLAFFNNSIKRKRQKSVMSPAMNDTREIARSKYEREPAYVT